MNIVSLDGGNFIIYNIYLFYHNSFAFLPLAPFAEISFCCGSFGLTFSGTGGFSTSKMVGNAHKMSRHCFRVS